MKRYAPAGDNNTSAYIAAIATAIHGKADDKLSVLSSDQLDILKETIRVSEGWRDRNRATSPPAVAPPAAPATGGERRR